MKPYGTVLGVIGGPVDGLSFKQHMGPNIAFSLWYVYEINRMLRKGIISWYKHIWIRC